MPRRPADRLDEGMRAGDLEDMVLPLVSLDEYQSKVAEGDEAVVLGLFVQDIQAADDLNRFIQKSAIDILDTERSPAPDQTGYFFVFVELPNNARLGDNIASVLDEIGPLAGIDRWQVRLRGASRIMPFDAEKIDRIFERRRRRSLKAAEPEMAKESSGLPRSSVRDTPGKLIEGALAGVGAYEIVDRGPLDDVWERNGLDGAPVSFAPRDLLECRRIANVLGEEIDVTRIGDRIVIHDRHEAILLRHS